jgi:hypothetical protein
MPVVAEGLVGLRPKKFRRFFEADEVWDRFDCDPT